MSNDAPAPGRDFIRTVVAKDGESGKWDGKVLTRFPPEPNGFLHIGHAKAMSVNFGIAEDFGGRCNLRFDDTNPIKEEDRFVTGMQEDIQWMGYEWNDDPRFASDYFQQMYDWAVQLIKAGKAYVCDLSAEEMSMYRIPPMEPDKKYPPPQGKNSPPPKGKNSPPPQGKNSPPPQGKNSPPPQGKNWAPPPGKNSPHRDRTVEENLDLFARMKAGEFKDGARVLRAKIDMASPNLNMRDPVMYRIMKVHHHRSGDAWCIYPTYDWAHGLGDSIEGVTHSLCTLEFEDHRPLYDWFLDQLGVHHPQQIEYAPLGLTYTMLSKRKLLQHVEEKHVSGWDDPRMPTIRGLRRRGYTAAAIRDFCSRIGLAKANSTNEIELLEHCLREELNKTSPRVMAVLRPLKIVITNYPENESEEFEAVNNPEDPAAGTRKVPFTRELYIEREDFMEDPPRKFFRLSPGKEVRLRYAYFVTCQEVIKDPNTGEVTELRCTYDPETKGGNNPPDGRKVKATLHWVSAAHAIEGQARLYNRFYTKENPLDVAEDGDWKDNINPESVEVLEGCKLEPSVAGVAPGDRYQFERLGYFCVDNDSNESQLVFNRSVTLKDAWARIQKSKK
jgi:glutaminyl-tRNA synthetase